MIQSKRETWKTPVPSVRRLDKAPGARLAGFFDEQQTLDKD